MPWWQIFLVPARPPYSAWQEGGLVRVRYSARTWEAREISIFSRSISMPLACFMVQVYVIAAGVKGVVTWAIARAAFFKQCIWIASFFFSGFSQTWCTGFQLRIFFDLIFVVALGKVTHFLVHVHHGHLSEGINFRDSSELIKMVLQGITGVVYSV